VLDSRDPYFRLATAGFDWFRLSWTVAETMIASQSVIAKRMTMIGKGSAGSYGELARMVPEKMSAFGKARDGAAREMAGKSGASQRDRLESALVGDTMAMFDLGEQMLAASLAWWQPLHAGATSNAKRLRRRR
jgi:hypothetical protein